MSVNFLPQLLKTCRKIGLPLWMAMLLYNSLDQFFTSEMEKSLRSPDGTSPWLWLYGTLSFGLGLLVPVLLTLLILYGLSPGQKTQLSWSSFVHKNWQLLMIETLRSWGKSMIWGLALIIPGIYQFFLYSLVPFIVSFSKNYDLGKKDALQYSSELVKKKWGAILLALLVFHLILPSAFAMMVDDYKLFWNTPFSSLAVAFIDSLLWILGIQILYRITMKLISEAADELTI